MNRRNFFKLLSITPLAPSVLAALPVAEVMPAVLKLWPFQEIIAAELRWPEYHALQISDPLDPEFLREFRAAYKNTKFRRPKL